MPRVEDLVLDSEQRRAVEESANILRVLAAAGSGKTRVLTQRVARRIQAGEIEPAHVLVLTFTRKAAEELQRRLRDAAIEGVTAGTFHGIAYGELRAQAGARVPRVVSPATILERLDTGLRRGIPHSVLAAEIGWAKGRGLTPEHPDVETRKGALSATVFRRLFAAYEAEKRKRGVIDFDDILLLHTRAMRSDPEVKSAQQWRYRHVFVDEFQDLNALQFALMREWVQGDLCVVGDPNQAIYEWNGANAQYLQDFLRYFPEATTVQLTTNYRSTGAILHVAGRVLSHGATTSAETGEVPTVVSYATEAEEAFDVARRVREANRNGIPWREIAVLFRTNAQRTMLIEELERLGIPTSGLRNWTTHESVRAALKYLRSDLSMPLQTRAADLLLDEDLQCEEGEELNGTIQRFLTSKPEASIVEFLDWLEVSQRFDGPSGKTNAVVVTTFHRAKGLEWPVVFLTGVEEGFVPILNTSNLDEEKRLFYVGMTRAQQTLTLSYAHNRALGEKRESRIAREPSRWLHAVRAGVSQLREKQGGACDFSQSIASLRADVNETIEASKDAASVPQEDSPTQKLRTQLHEWRQRHAKLVGTLPQVLLTDDELERIVDLRPTSQDELIHQAKIRPIRAHSMAEGVIALCKEVPCEP